MRTALSRILWISALLGVAIGLGACGGGGGGGSGIADSLLSVNDAQAFPNGKFLPTAPSPSTLNQCIWIELTAEVDPSTVFDNTTSNGLSSAVRCLSYYYLDDAANITPATLLTRERLPGIPVLNGLTSFDATTKSYRSTASIPVSHESLHIDTNVPLTGDRANYLVFVADSDGDLETIESFLPQPLKKNTARLQNSQIMVNLTRGVKSVKGKELSPEFIGNFIVGESDQIPPVVDSVTPASGSASASVGTLITVTFSEPIAASSFVPAPIGSNVPSNNPQVNFQASVQYILPGQSLPQLIDEPGFGTPSSGQTTSITFNSLFSFPGDTLVRVNIYSAASTLIQTPPPYHAAVTDPSGNPLSPNVFTDGNYTFTTGAGPQRANNPIDPECVHFITSTSAMGTVRTSSLDRAATGVEDVIQEVNQDGDLAQFFPGGVQDGVVGPFIANLLGTGRNTINDPPRQCQYWLLGFAHRGNPPTTNVVDPGKYTPPGYADDILCTGTTALPSEPPPAPPPPNYCPESVTPGFQNIKPAQPYGVYLFVTNEAENVVHCVSSSTFQIVKDIKTPDPRGVAISPDFNYLYVSNFGANSVSVLDVSAGQDGLPNGKSIRLIPVDSGPWGIAAQPNGEDILVCNRLGKTVSVIAVSDLGNPGSPVRVTVQSGDPYELTAGARLTVFNLPYYAFITNPGTDEVTIFESGPPQINGFGRDQVIDIVSNLDRPTGISGDQWFNVSSYQNPVPSNDSIAGAFVVLNGDGTVVHLKATRFSIPVFPNPPPALVEARFEVKSAFKVGENPKDVCVDTNLIWCATPDGKQWPYTQTNPPAPITVTPTRLYVTNGDGSIGVHEIRTGTEVARLKANGASRIFSYYKQ